MKHIILAWLLLGTSLAMVTDAASYNPYVSEGIVSPAPLLPVEFNGAGELSFNVGNTGSDALPLVSDQEMKLVITLSDGVPNNVEPLAALGGTWKSLFTWSYDASDNTYTGVQNQAIPGGSQGTIVIQYKVTNNTPIGVASNGVNVNITPPDYSGGQPTDDDAVDSFTYVRAMDYGDGPLSYGLAGHEINVFKTGGIYTYYLFLGSSVDPEPDQQYSDAAAGDDLNGADDEDGVTFPPFTAGGTATVPVVVTIVNSGIAFLNAWIDWNADGDVGDPGEKIVDNRFVAVSGTQMITVSVPSDAIPGVRIARFRLGDYNLSPSGLATYGEVEDYQITISTPTAATLASFRATSVPGQGALLTWDTLVEAATLGFHVDRSTASGGWDRITPALVPATGLDQTPQSYTLADRQAPSLPDLSYRLMGIDLQGNERVLAEAQLQEGMSIASAVQGSRFTLNVNGLPNANVSVEAAPTVLGPWTRLQTVTLEENGSGKIEFEMDTALSAQFYRISSE